MNETSTSAQRPATPKWAVRCEDKPVVTKIAKLPDFEALEPYERAKPRPGEPVSVRFAISVIAEPTGFQSKRAFVASPGPGWSHFEVFCDEGTALGGTDQAPPPLGYLSAGVAFCLLTHIQGYIGRNKLNIDRLKVELRAKFMTARGGQGAGASEGFETFVIIDSPEPPEKIKELVDVCDRACMAMQTVVNAVPASTSLILNDERI